MADTIRRRTDGLSILLRAGLVELTLEWLVVDTTKPYHDLFEARTIKLAQARVVEFEREGIALPGVADGRGVRPVDISQTVAEIARWFERRLIEHPDGYDLPVVHSAQATLLRIESDRALVRRGSGSLANPALRLLALRVHEMANGRSFRQSELREGSARDSAVIGALLADLPSVDVSNGVFHVAQS